MSLTVTDYMIWPVMFGNGVRIGLIVVKVNKCCEAVLGTARPAIFDWPIAIPSLRVIGVT